MADVGLIQVPGFEGEHDEDPVDVDPETRPVLRSGPGVEGNRVRILSLGRHGERFGDGEGKAGKGSKFLTSAAIRQS